MLSMTEVIQALKEGKRVRRKKWGTKTWLFFTAHGRRKSLVTQTSDWPCLTYQLDGNDILGKDWPIETPIELAVPARKAA